MFCRHGLSDGNSGQPAIDAEPAGSGATCGVVGCVDVDVRDVFGAGAGVVRRAGVLTAREGAAVERAGVDDTRVDESTTGARLEESC
jgi:hypothetical protein